MALRLELLTPGPTIMTAMTYNRLFTLHGVVMVCLFMIPAIPASFGNFLLPIMLGAKDVAFPRLNLASFYLYLAGAALVARGRWSTAASTPAGRSTRPTARTTPTAVAPVAARRLHHRLLDRS